MTIQIKKIIFLLFTVVAISTFGQDEKKCQEIDNKKAEKLYEQGIDKKNKKEERLAYLKQALELEPDYVDANFAYAEERIKTLIYEDAAFKPTEPYFKKVIEICPKYHSDPYYYLGFIYYEEENWADCEKYLKEFINFKEDDEKKYNKIYDAFLAQAKEMIRFAKLFNEIYKHPVPFEPTPVNGICTEKDEYLPTISADNTMMLFTRKVPFIQKGLAWESDKEVELFSKSIRNKTNGEFDKGQAMPYPFNKGGNEGGATISIDNKHLFFTVINNEAGAVNADIYFSDFSSTSGDWSMPKKVPGINDPERWDSQPSLASDGKTLYFASDRKGGRGGVDLYITVQNPITGEWSKPENLGPAINTSGDEMSPFMHSDFQTLYFSSNGHPGVGGYDIFFSRKGADGKWAEPKNIGVPINTTNDDLGFFVSTDGHLGYFASNQPSRAKGKFVGKYDIYSFELYKEARPEAVAFITGKVEDQANVEKKDFKVEIKDAVTKKVTLAMVDTITGSYAGVQVINEKEKHDLIVTVKKDNYAFSSQLIMKDSIVNAKPATVNIAVDTIKVDQTYPLNNIYYKTNSAELDPRSMVVIEEFIEFLKNNPSIKIAMNGHTDNVGNDAANLALSTDRAFTVRDILLANGIAENRLFSFKGFGASMPIADNSTEAGRAKNRRTEFVIISK